MIDTLADNKDKEENKNRGTSVSPEEPSVDKRVNSRLITSLT